MMSGEEGKLLAGAAGFYSPWGSERMKQEPSYFALRFFLFYAKRDASQNPAVPAFRFAPIRVREKRMNTHKTLKTRWSYQKAVK
jgi:hypothetical protein